MSEILERQITTTANDIRAMRGTPGHTWQSGIGDELEIVGYVDSDVDRTGNGLRYLDIGIPKGAVIEAAYLKVKSCSDFNVNTVNSVIIGQAADNPGVFSTIADYQARRGTIVGGANDNNITAASVTWNAIGSWIEGETYNSPDIKTIIQEIINRDGWVPGNALVLFWDDHAGNSSTTPSAIRGGFAYDHAAGPELTAILHIEWSPPPLDGNPGFFQGGLNSAYGGMGFLLGSPAMQARYFGWLFGNPTMNAELKRYLAGSVEASYGGWPWFLLGSLTSYFGKGGYLQGNVTAVPRIPKPNAGSVFMRIGAVTHDNV